MIAFIPSAGLGTRLKPLTDHCPKALVEYRGKPLLAHVLQRLQEEGYRKFVLNVHHFPDMIRRFAWEYAREQNVRIAISDESDLLLDTGGALTHALPFFGGEDSVLVHNVDVLSDIDLGAMRRRMADDRLDALLSVRKRESGRFLYSDADGRLRSWQDVRTGACKGDLLQADFSAYAFSGVHMVRTALVSEWAQNYGDDKPFSVIDAYLEAVSRHRRVFLEPQQGGYWRDMGKIADFH